MCGLHSDAVQKCLLSTKGLTFQDALDMAQVMELAALEFIVRKLCLAPHL